ncbi:MAG TPA: hypothetical protein VFI45_07490 [Candidatus Acidoferrum sp.]|nr:hypothetical protein [Candidatus Acidoferrum sp.]
MSFPIGKVAFCSVLVVVWLNLATTSLGQDATSKRGQRSDVVVQKAASKVQCSGSQKPHCAEEEFRKNGNPIMLPADDGIAFGVSVSPTNQTDIFVWMDNQTKVTQSYLDACNVSFLKAFIVYDSNGRRLRTKTEEKSPPHSSDQFEVEECSCCVVFAVAPHTMQVVDHGNLGDAYALLPGQYLIKPINPHSKGITVMIPDNR